MSTLTLNLDDRHMEALDALATEQDMSKTAVLRQALRLYQLVHHRAKDGQQLAFTKDGRTVIIELIGPTLMPVAGAADQGCAAHGLAHPCEACAAEIPLHDALQQIADMDPAGQRADDLGKAARVARAALTIGVEGGGDAPAT